MLVDDVSLDGLEPVAGFEPAPSSPIELNVVGMPRRRRVEEDLFAVPGVSLLGIEFKLFDPRRLYPDDDRVSFLMVGAPGCPALDGRLVLAENAQQCARYEGTPVTEAEWYFTGPRIHLRYFAERWMDLLLAWVKRFYLPDLAWWRHDDMTGWEDFAVLVAGREADVAREAALESLGELFRQEASRWLSPAPATVRSGAVGPFLTMHEGLASYLAAGDR